LLNYLLSEEDRLPMQEYGSWTAEKLDYLARYIDVFETSIAYGNIKYRMDGIHLEPSYWLHQDQPRLQTLLC